MIWPEVISWPVAVGVIKVQRAEVGLLPVHHSLTALSVSTHPHTHTHSHFPWPELLCSPQSEDTKHRAQGKKIISNPLIIVLRSYSGHAERKRFSLQLYLQMSALNNDDVFICEMNPDGSKKRCTVLTVLFVVKIILQNKTLLHKNN